MIVGFLGSGNMAAGMARGWASAPESVAPERMLFTDSGSGRAGRLGAGVGGEAVGSNAELASACDLLILGVKPKDLESTAAEAQAAPAVLSMLGATPVDRVAAAYPHSSAMRVMPNLGVQLRSGVMCFSAAEGVEASVTEPVLELLRGLGRVEVMEDTLIDPATAVMGCTPAYFAQIAEVVAEAGAEAGLDPELSMSLLRDTMATTAELLRDTVPQDLIAAVASPGGSTEAGLDALRDRDLRATLEAAVHASLERMGR